MSPSFVRHEIENTLNRYALGYDDGDLAMVKNTFTSEAVLTLRVADGALVGPFEGREAIVNMMREASHSQSDQRRHITTNVIIDVEGDRAESVSYLTIFSAQDGTLTALSMGKYEDELVHTEAGWKLSKRHITLDLPY